MPTLSVHSRWDLHRAEPGYEFYLPELYYFADASWYFRTLSWRRKDFPAARVAQVTLRCLARWADRYWATPSSMCEACRGGPGPFPREPDVREGRLPDSSETREAFADELFRWLDAEQPDILETQFELFAGDRRVLDARFGFPGTLQLRPEHFAALQDELEAAGLPRDTYFPLREQREAIEPVADRSGVVRRVRLYTPQQWAHRDTAATEAIAVPSDEERRDRFVEACWTAARAVALRLAEMREPGRPLHSDEIGELVELWTQLHLAMERATDRVEGAPRRSTQHEPLFAQPHPPTAFQALQSSLPALRRLHPQGSVVEISDRNARLDQPATAWRILLWDPSREHQVGYRVQYGVLFGPPWESPTTTNDRSAIWPLEQDTPPALIDSDEALARAEAAGGRRYREELGGQLFVLQLEGAPDRRLVWTAGYGRYYEHTGLEIALDARTGEIVSVKEEPPPPPDAAV
jgi:hypothetical protein